MANRRIVPVVGLLLVALLALFAWIVLSGGDDPTVVEPEGDPEVASVDEDDVEDVEEEKPEIRTRRWVPRGPGSVTGIVKEYGTDKPVAGAAVSLEAGLPGPGEVVRATTGDDGSFVIEDAINFDQWMLRISPAKPLTEMQMQAIEVSEGQTTDLGVIYLSPGFEVPGIVVDEYGEPVAGALVRALRPRPKGSQTDFLRLIRELPQRAASVDETTTGADGRFVLTKVAPGRYSIELTAADYAMKTERGIVITPESAQRELRFVLHRGFEIKGRVIRQDGGSLEGVPVSAFEEPSNELDLFNISKRFALTDAEGLFHLKGLSPGEMIVVAMPEGLPFTAVDDINIPSTEFVEITIQGDCWLEGFVTGDEDVPIDGAEVYVVQIEGGNPKVGQAFTEPDGSYRVDGLKSGDVQIFLVQAEGYGTYPEDMFAVLRGGSSDESLLLEPGRNERDVSLARGATVRGVVLSQDTDEPVPGVRVSLLSAMQFFGGTREDTTDAEGKFEIVDVPKGMAVLLAEKDGWYQPGVTPQSVGMMAARAFQGGQATPDTGTGVSISVTDAGQELERTLKLGVGSVVTGIVLTPAGEPLAGAQVRLELESGRGMFGALSGMMGSIDPRLTDAEGRFEIPGPPPGRKGSIVATAQGYLDGETEDLTVAPGETLADVTVTMREGAVITGIVSAKDGTRLNGALVRWLDKSTVQGDWQIRWRLRNADPVSTDMEGNFRIANVEPSDLVVQVTHPEYLSAAQSDVKTEDGKAITLDFQLDKGGVISGLVTGPDGVAFPGARVNISREGGEATAADPYARTPGDVRSDPDGNFQIDALAKGTYTLSAEVDGYAPSAPIVVEPGAAAVTLRLEMSFEISGFVRMEDGAGANQVQVQATRQVEEGQPGTSESTTTSSDGSFTISDLPSGTYTLSVSSGWWGAQNGASVIPTTLEGVQAGQGGVEIRVSGGLEISGTVVKHDGEAVLEGWVSCNQIVEPGSGETAHNGGAPITEAGFTVTGLPPGRYTLSTWVDGSPSAKKEVEAGASDVELRLFQGGTIRGRVTSPDGTSVSGAWVSASSENGSANAQTDENGDFEINGAAPGANTVNVWWQNDGKPMQGVREGVEVSAGGDVGGIDIQLEPQPIPEEQ